MQNEQIHEWEHTNNTIQKPTRVNYLNVADDTNIDIAEINDMLQILDSFTYSARKSELFRQLGKTMLLSKTVNKSVQKYISQLP